LAHPFVCNVERVYLMTTHQTEFYEHIGFEQNSSTTLVLCNSEFQGELRGKLHGDKYFEGVFANTFKD
jgi:hypothetical protein